MWRPTTGSSPMPLCPSGSWSGPRPRPRSPRSAAPRPTCAAGAQAPARGGAHRAGHMRCTKSVATRASAGRPTSAACSSLTSRAGRQRRRSRSRAVDGRGRRPAASRWPCAAVIRASRPRCWTCLPAVRVSCRSSRSRASRRVSFREGDVFELGLGEDLDVVSIFNLVHHLPEERDRELCRMAHAALRPGGAPVIGDSARPSRASPCPNMARSRASSSTPGATAATSSPPSSVPGWRRRGSPTSDTPQRALALARGGGGPPVILLTGATGTVGTALLRSSRMSCSPCAVSCGIRAVSAISGYAFQIALGDLADPASFAMPCVA